jgi:CspA family cold shock protein
MLGRVKFFDTNKGYGFITPDDGGLDIFVHATAVEASKITTLAQGERVTFDVLSGKRGPVAVNLKLV